jgi:hypothetical protein
MILSCLHADVAGVRKHCLAPAARDGVQDAPPRELARNERPP